jgi:serine protease
MPPPTLHRHRWRRAVAAVLAALLPLAAGAPVASSAAAAAATSDAATEVARVIVGYLPDADIAREHPLQRRDDPIRARASLQRRADVLARRAGVPLVTGRAIGDRAHVVVARGLRSQELAERLAKDPGVAYAVVDERRHALAWPDVPDDPLFAAGPADGKGPEAGQWYLRTPTDLFKSAANVQSAWARTTGSPSVVVAVLDTGVLFDHLDLAGRLLPGFDMISNAQYANDGGGRDTSATDPGDWISAFEHGSGTFRGCPIEASSWHGTKVAGIIGAATHNGIGMAGIAPDARILPVRVLGKCGGFDSDITAGMLWAAGIDQPGLPGSTTPARVLNLSLGGDGACATVYREAVEQVVARGAVVVAAAGNTTGRAVGTPANCPGVLAVAGLRHAGTKVGFSDLGPEIAIGAPGGNCVNINAGEPCLYPILTASNSGSTVPEAGGSKFTDSFDITVGTSFATPIVAGTVALVLSARPELQPAEVRQVLQATARAYPVSGADNGADDPTPVAQCQPPGSEDQLQCYCTAALCGAGMLDAAAAVASAADAPFARIAVTPAAPLAGAAVGLSGTGSLVGPGRSVAAWSWTLVSSGGITSGFPGAADASTASLPTTGGGTIVVRLAVTDDLGATSSVDRSIVVAALAPAPPPAGDGGGGAFSAAWAALLALAAWALLHAVRRPKRQPR